METPLHEQISKLTECIQGLTKSHEELKKQMQDACVIAQESCANVSMLSKKTDSFEKRLEFFDRKDRANNIIIFGLEDKEVNSVDLCSIVLSIFKNLDIRIPELAVADTYRLGKTGEKRPVIVKFIAPRWVQNVFMKITEFRKLDLAVANDRTKQERELRKSLILQADTIRKTGKKVTIKRGKLIVEGAGTGEQEVEATLENNKNSAPVLKNAENSPFTIARPSPRRGPGRRTKKEIPENYSAAACMNSFVIRENATPTSSKVDRFRKSTQE
ncbi:uncharacterized protein LOC122507815 [Leptopilina heterotoma]|uniref:uncharacterized protein LOC122507815 n=1 Tax=Leptopilina heterotoma TaxID=63436 RepID=UPI001CA9BDBA|nr:uncharacterized protein LOC122507815 [Leptopilina heterotoma]